MSPRLSYWFHAQANCLTIVTVAQPGDNGRWQTAWRLPHRTDKGVYYAHVERVHHTWRRLTASFCSPQLTCSLVLWNSHEPFSDLSNLCLFSTLRSCLRYKSLLLTLLTTVQPAWHQTIPSSKQVEGAHWQAPSDKSPTSYAGLGPSTQRKLPRLLQLRETAALLVAAGQPGGCLPTMPQGSPATSNLVGRIDLFQFWASSLAVGAPCSSLELLFVALLPAPGGVEPWNYLPLSLAKLSLLCRGPCSGICNSSSLSLLS